MFALINQLWIQINELLLNEEICFGLFFFLCVYRAWHVKPTAEKVIDIDRYVIF